MDQVNAVASLTQRESNSKLFVRIEGETEGAV
jgi:hypothetical protein